MVTGGTRTRREFLSSLLRAFAGAGMYSFIPMPFPQVTIGSIKEETHPYWLDVLSRGIDYFPENIVSFFSGWSADQFTESTQYALLLTLNQNKRTLANAGLPPDREMDQVIEINKTTQYIFDQLKKINLDRNSLPEVTYGNDAFHARLLYDLSAYILRNIVRSVDEPGFTELSDFDMALLDSGTTYLEEAIRMSENVYIISDADFKEILTMNLGAYYNNLGLTVSYLGEMEQADRYFRKALEYRPDDELIIENLQNMNSKLLFIRKKIYSHSLLD
ncbi:hypothetical protein EG833_03325 [archaeon]|nr:hypothetical protein [archaeon]